jgi:hypothetical protein
MSRWLRSNTVSTTARITPNLLGPLERELILIQWTNKLGFTPAHNDRRKVQIPKHDRRKVQIPKHDRRKVQIPKHGRRKDQIPKHDRRKVQIPKPDRRKANFGDVLANKQGEAKCKKKCIIFKTDLH